MPTTGLQRTIGMVINLLACIFLLIPLTHAFEITEVELNPLGNDAGAEWIELYANQETALNDLTFENGDNETYQVNGSFNGYHVLQFAKQWLDNTNETIKVKRGSLLLTSVGPFKDDKNSLLSWSICNDVWKFSAATKGAANTCEPPTQQTSSISENNNKTPVLASKQENKKSGANKSREERINSSEHALSAGKEENSQENTVIRLTNHATQTPITFTSKEGNIRLWISYTFTFLCIGIIFFLLSTRNL